MRSRARLGCLTPLGMISTLIVLAFVGMTALARGGVLFSPGALNAEKGKSLGGVTSHAELEGECSACHTAPWSSETMADRCMACHTNIAQERNDPASLHGIIAQRDPALFCAACHTEHKGEMAPLTVQLPSAFPHDTLGFSLLGHQQRDDGQMFQCADCHGDSLTTFEQQTCIACHEQREGPFMAQHGQDFGTDCLACHDGVDQFGAAFSHNALAFPLEGKHIEVECTACHENVRTAADFQSAPQKCADCHAQDDVHEGRFGECGVCHTPVAWEPAIFDHNLADFPLEGKHVDVECEACHTGETYQGTPQDCFSCHKQDDAHDGSFGTACESCHTPAGWTPATFDHNLSAFPLEGAHQQVDCDACHIDGKFKGTPQDCYSCHKQDDEHNGRFGTQCEACHNATSWEDVTFDHDRSGFPLTGAHINVRCENCHVNNQFAGTPTDCVACHAEPNWHAGALGTDCAACHSTSAWQPAKFTLSHPEPRVDEEGTGVNHGYTTCQTCHPSSVRTYTCLACHTDNQGGEGENDDD